MENAKPNISPRRGMTPLERAWAAALCASGDAVANMGTDALRLMATKKLQDVTSAGIMESTHKLARACRIIDVSTASTPALAYSRDYSVMLLVSIIFALLCWRRSPQSGRGVGVLLTGGFIVWLAMLYWLSPILVE